MDNKEYTDLLDREDFKRFYAKILSEYGQQQKADNPWYGNKPLTARDVTSLLMGAGINPVTDGVVPPQLFAGDKGQKQYNFSRINRVGTGAFMNSSLETADLRHVKYIDGFAFMHTPIKELYLAEDAVIGQNAFSGCGALEELYIPAGVTFLDRKGTTAENNYSGAFSLCGGLTDVFIEDGRTQWPFGVFDKITQIPVVYIPKALKAGNLFMQMPSPMKKMKINHLVITSEPDDKFIEDFKQVWDDKFIINHFEFDPGAE